MAADARDPLYFGVARDGAAPDFIAFTRGDDGRIDDGLRCDSLVRMVKAS